MQCLQYLWNFCLHFAYGHELTLLTVIGYTKLISEMFRLDTLTHLSCN